VQALQAGEKMDLTVQKAVELGVERIVPVISRRSVLRLDGERALRRLEHWRGVVVAACEQCGRNRSAGSPGFRSASSTGWRALGRPVCA
jgi:16S rRNA (uracil1498-N3)-methyltransferase